MNEESIVVSSKDKLGIVRLAYRCMAIMALVGGIGIYAFFRNIDAMILFRFFSKPGFLNGLPFHPDTGNLAVSVFVFHGPNMLWLLSGLFFIRSVWIANKKWMQLYLIVFFLIALANEMAQISPGIPGTFDVFDLLFMCLAAFLESAIYQFSFNRRIE